MLDRFGRDAEAMTRLGAQRQAARLRRLRPRGLRLRARGRSRGARIVEKAAHAIEALIRRVEALGARRVALVGGDRRVARPYFEPSVAAVVTRPLRDAIDGAILIAGGALGENDGPTS